VTSRCCSPVELDAMRVARPVRGRLLRVIPSKLEGRIREFYPMAVVWLKSGDGEKPCTKRSQKMRTVLGQAVAAKAGELSNRLLDK
jgi:hypothetical protein